MSSASFDFSGKVVVVTGGASGIGMATVEMFLGAHAKVVLVDVDTTKTWDLIKGLGAEIHTCVPVDVSDSKRVLEISRDIKGTFGRVDVLVNNAGIEFNDRGNILGMPEEDLRRILDVNLMGYINMARAFVPLMRHGGRVINVSSVQGLATHLPGTSYQVAKAGILGLTRSLAVELASRGITVNTIAPGAIKTEGMGAVRVEESEILDPYRRRIPAGRRGWAEEVAGPILFLASRLASYITGTTLVVDGGYLVSITPDLHPEETPFVMDDPDRLGSQ